VAQPIITPEAVVLDLDRAGVASRTLAMIVDGLALTATWLVLVLSIGLVVGVEGTGGAIYYVVFSVLLLFAWFWGWESMWHGRTPGKAAMGLRVVGADGTPIRFQQAFLRATVGFVDFLLIPIGCIAVVAVLLSPRDQRLGDLAAGTLVVRERSARSYVAPAWFPTPPGYERYAASLDVTELGEEGYEVVRSFLLRSAEMSTAARDHMAVRIANAVSLRINHRPAQFLHPHAFLACVASAWQEAHGLRPPAWQPAPQSGWGPPPAMPGGYGGPPRPGYPPPAQPGYPPRQQPGYPPQPPAPHPGYPPPPTPQQPPHQG
jgi:uncharacterized RDD family membrane protein YckC